jgi:mRNA interferase MazF
VIRRGQIWWVDFAEPRGSEPGYRHPVLVLQRDENTLLPRRATRLRRDSVANGSQIATVSKSDLDEMIGTLPRGLLDAVDQALRWFLHLD